MSILNITGLKKILGSQEILRGGDLRIERGEKMGCVGRNGEGKTTLLRLIEGEETPDGGEIKLSKGCRLAYVEQRPNFARGMTVRAYVEGGLSEVHALEAQLEKTGEAMGTLEGEELDAILKLHGELTERMDFLGGWETERTVETVLSGIGLATHLWDREARTLSGGEKSRTAIARELISAPDLLLLDEPTNHLDLAGIEWIENYIHEMKSAVFIVSHDRRLLDRVVTTIVEVERGLLNRYSGNYSRYVARKEERFQEQNRAWEQQQAEMRREENFIKKHMGSQRTAEAKGRRKKLGNVVRLPQPFNDVRRPIIRMGDVERGGEEVLSVENLSVGHGDKVLFTAPFLRIGRGERIGVVGPNGSGKTTLLRVLAGVLPPLSGEMRLGHKANCGYYDQETATLRNDGTPYTEIRRDHPHMTDLEIRKHLARFLFRGSEIDHSVSSLSGGERSRLSLGRLVLSGPSWLALDEPTNHLDLAGRTALEEMLSEFHGALLCVSHDRAFLDSLVQTIFEVKEGSVRVIQGNYSDYRASIELEESESREEAQRAKDKQAQRAAQRNTNNKPQAQTGRGSAKRKKGKKDKKAHNPWRIEQLERDIISLESEREELLTAMGTEAVFKNPEAARETQVRLAEVERDLSDKNKEWEECVG